MRALLLLGVPLVGGAELVALLLRQRQLLLAGSGVVLAVLLFGIRRLLAAPDTGSAPKRSDPADDADVLQRWVSGAETRIRWADSTRTDWDRHWRPVLARRFEIVTGLRRETDPAAFDAGGALLLGSALWSWVDPVNVAASDDGRPGPGCAALEQILQRLEQR